MASQQNSAASLREQTGLSKTSVRKAVRGVNHYRKFRQKCLRDSIKSFLEDASLGEVEFLIEVFSWRECRCSSDEVLGMVSAFEYATKAIGWRDYVKVSEKHFDQVLKYVKQLEAGEDPLAEQTGVWRVWTPSAGGQATHSGVRP